MLANQDIASLISRSRKRPDLTGRTFDRLTVLRCAESDQGRPHWECVCQCGQTVVIRGDSLTGRRVRSCGCLRKETAREIATHVLPSVRTRHGHAAHGRSSTEYRAYHAAKHRCTNPNNRFFEDYGGRGIEFRFTSFEQFIGHIGMKPSPELELDRIDNDSHYAIGNVRWATHSTQMSNRRAGKRQGVRRVG